KLASHDVIHSFWVPNLSGKKDLLPGHKDVIWIRADRAGVYRGQCAEFCGLEHAKMALLVVAESTAEFTTWIEHQREPAPAPIDEVLLPPAIDEADRARLHATWEPVIGVVGWLKSVNHKSVGKRYICTALVFFLLGGLEAATIRMQLSRPENTLVGPDLYNQIFTMRGTTMMFLFAVPIMTAVGIYLVPLMIGTRNVAFPRLNALGFWVYLFGGIFLYAFFFSNTGPDAGWFAYVPLSGPQYGMGKRVDVYAQMVTFTEIAALIAAL